MFEDMESESFDLSRFCAPAPTSVLFPELTEAELQQLEQRAEDWYMSMM